MQLDLTQVPFSRFGSYLSLMYPPGFDPTARSLDTSKLDSLCLRSHRARGVGSRELLRLSLADGSAIPADRVSASASELSIAEPAGPIHMCFDGTESLRLRGQSALRFEPLTGNIKVLQPLGEGRYSLNLRGGLCRLLFEPLRGRLVTSANWQVDRSEGVVVQIEPDDSGQWDLAIEVYQSTYEPRERSNYEQARETSQQDYEAFVAKLPGSVVHDDLLKTGRELAGYICWASTVRPEGFYHRPAMMMSKVVMDQVWSWDNCFNAMALVEQMPELAWDQLWVMIDHQDVWGAFPDALNPMFKHYNFSKPPVLGWALRCMMQQRDDWFSVDKLEAIYEPLVRWSQWWLKHRRMPGDTLAYYLHGNDSGWDNSTMFDEGAPLVAPDLATALVLQFEVLGELAETLGRGDEAEAHQAQSRQLLEALLSELWRGDHFIARRCEGNLEVHCDSLIPCIPLALGRRLPAEVTEALCARLKRLLTEHGPATEMPDSPKYSADGYWRGPIWAPSTMLIVSGLLDLGKTDTEKLALARDIAGRFCRMCARSGMAENFDALTGEPLRDTAYTWTSSVYLLLLEHVQ